MEDVPENCKVYVEGYWKRRPNCNANTPAAKPKRTKPKSTQNSRKEPKTEEEWRELERRETERVNRQRAANEDSIGKVIGNYEKLWKEKEVAPKISDREFARKKEEYWQEKRKKAKGVPQPEDRYRYGEDVAEEIAKKYKNGKTDSSDEEEESKKKKKYKRLRKGRPVQQAPAVPSTPTHSQTEQKPKKRITPMKIG